MTSAADRRKIIQLVDEARRSGARLRCVCQELGISQNTYRRWLKSKCDKRPTAIRPTPANALTPAERRAVLQVCNRS